MMDTTPHTPNSRKDKTMTRDSAVRFFYSHAGYSYDPKTETKNAGRWRCARMLAAAEHHATKMEWRVTWDYDSFETLDGSNHASPTNLDGWCKPDCGIDHECLDAVLKDPRGRVLASLGGIWDADRNYRRVVAAELAHEAMTQISDEVMEAL